MSNTHAVSNTTGIVRYGPIPVNLITSELSVPLASAQNEQLKIIVSDVFVYAKNVNGNLSQAPIVLIQTGNGVSVTGSKTLTDIATDTYSKIAILDNAGVAVGGDLENSLKLAISTSAAGQQTTFRQRTDNIATITTQAAHGLVAGDETEVQNIDGDEANAFNGRVIVISTPSATTFTYFNEGADEASTADVEGLVGACDVEVFVWAQQLD